MIWRYMHSKYTTYSDTKATHLTLAMVLRGEPVLLRWFDPDEHDAPKAKSGMLENISVRSTSTTVNDQLGWRSHGRLLPRSTDYC